MDVFPFCGVWSSNNSWTALNQNLISFRESHINYPLSPNYNNKLKILSPVGLRKKTEADAMSAPEVARKSLGGPELYTALYNTELYTALHSTTLSYTALHCTTLSSTLHFTALR